MKSKQEDVKQGVISRLFVDALFAPPAVWGVRGNLSDRLKKRHYIPLKVCTPYREKAIPY